jgi:outer membrane protein TolC
MKYAIVLALFISLNATEIDKLLEAIKKTPQTKLDEIMIKEMKTNKKSVISSLYPKITLTASAEHFSEPSNIRPLPPTESAKILASKGGLPFSQNIYRIGFNISMPIFIKEIYDNKKKMQTLLKATKYQAKLNLLKRQASLITLVSNLNYLYELKKALIKQKNSIQTTIDAIKVGVDVGRIPEFKLLRLKSSIISIKNKISNVNTKIEELKSKIYELTLIEVNSKIKLNASNINEGDFFALKPLKENLKSSVYDIKAKKDAFLPKVILKIQGNRAFAKAYNNNENLALNYASAGIYVSWDIFNKKNNSEIQKAKINQSKISLEIQKTINDLNAQINYINSSLKEIKKELLNTEESISIKEELLKGAKTAFKLNRMSVDDYLRYEDDLAKERANFANLIALKNSLIAQKALIYGKNLKKVFK